MKAYVHKTKPHWAPDEHYTGTNAVAPHIYVPNKGCEPDTSGQDSNDKHEAVYWLAVCPSSVINIALSLAV
jgi:hypothetical protein